LGVTYLLGLKNIYRDMKLTEQINKIKSMMGLLNEVHKCLPKDYKPGMKYDRDQLARMFVCYTGNPKKYPLIAVREWLFPKMYNGESQFVDPMKMKLNPFQTFTIEQIAKGEDKTIRNITVGIITLDINKFSDDTQKWMLAKSNEEGYMERLNYQKEKILKDGSLSVTPDNEPIVVQSINKKFEIREGWHRIISVFELLKEGKIEPEDAKLKSIIIYRTEGYSINKVIPR